MADLSILDKLRFVASQQQSKKRSGAALFALSQDSSASTQPVTVTQLTRQYSDTTSHSQCLDKPSAHLEIVRFGTHISARQRILSLRSESVAVSSNPHSFTVQSGDIVNLLNSESLLSLQRSSPVHIIPKGPNSESLTVVGSSPVRVVKTMPDLSVVPCDHVNVWSQDMDAFAPVILEKVSNLELAIKGLADMASSAQRRWAPSLSLVTQRECSLGLGESASVPQTLTRPSLVSPRPSVEPDRDQICHDNAIKVHRPRKRKATPLASAGKAGPVISASSMPGVPAAQAGSVSSASSVVVRAPLQARPPPSSVAVVATVQSGPVVTVPTEPRMPEMYPVKSLLRRIKTVVQY